MGRPRPRPAASEGRVRRGPLGRSTGTRPRAAIAPSRRRDTRPRPPSAAGPASRAAAVPRFAPSRWTRRRTRLHDDPVPCPRVGRPVSPTVRPAGGQPVDATPMGRWSLGRRRWEVRGGAGLGGSAGPTGAGAGRRRGAGWARADRRALTDDYDLGRMLRSRPSTARGPVSARRGHHGRRRGPEAETAVERADRTRTSRLDAVGTFPFWSVPSEPITERRISLKRLRFRRPHLRPLEGGAPARPAHRSGWSEHY